LKSNEFELSVVPLTVKPQGSEWLNVAEPALSQNWIFPEVSRIIIVPELPVDFV
jgi:hypothetical protein